MEDLNQSQSIRLGLVLEACIVPMLEKNGFKFANSESYAELLTRPDFILYDHGKPSVSLAVTATSSRDTWIKKRWRYVDEVAQLKSFYGEDFLTINVLYGSPTVFGINEMKFIDAFFDASIITEELNGGIDFLIQAERYVIDYPALSTQEIAARLESLPIWSTHCNSLIKSLKSILSKRHILTEKNLYRKVWQKEHPGYSAFLSEIKTRKYTDKISYLRYSILNGLLIGPDYMDAIIQSIKKDSPVSDAIYSACCEKTEFLFTNRLGKKYIVDEKLRRTVESGLTSDICRELEKTIFTNDTQRFLLDDIQDEKRLEKMVDIAWPKLLDQKSLTSMLIQSFLDNNYGGIAHARVWPIDVVVSYLGISIIQLNRKYVSRYRPSVTSVVVNFVSKIAIAQSQFSEYQSLCVFCEELAAVIFEEVSQVKSKPTKQELVRRIREYKIHSLSLQPYINPLQRYLEMILEKNGWAYKKDAIPCLLGAISDIPGSMKTIKEVYQVTKGKTTVWIKCIAGYDGVKDKTREMAARGHLLKYETPSSKKRTVKMVFAYDGKWSTDLKQLLALSGWDDIISIFDLEKYLSLLEP